MGKITQSFVNNVPFQPIIATIATSSSASNTIDCSKYQLLGIFIPSALSGTSLTFTASFENSTFVPVLETNGGSIYTIPVVLDRYVPLNPVIFAAIQYVRIISNAAEAANREFKCVLRPVS